MLKPGGKLYLFEHVQSQDPITKIFQDFWTACAWSHLFAGCHLNRPSGLWAIQSGEWTDIKLGEASTDTPASLLPVGLPPVACSLLKRLLACCWCIDKSLNGRTEWRDTVLV
jgi:hypothetical protein